MKSLRIKLSVIVAIVIIMVSVSARATSVSYHLSGLQSGDKATVTLSSTTYLVSASHDSDGSYCFNDVPVGLHSVTVEAPGYNLPKAQLVRVNDDGTVDPVVGIKIVITRMDEDPNKWTHHWEADGSVAGYTTTSGVNERPEIEFLGRRIVPADVSSAALLNQNYKIILSDDDEPWTQEYAYRLLETIKTLPKDYDNAKPGKFMLTSKSLTDDITVDDLGEGYEVTISKDAFYYANPFLVSLDGVRGRFFSKRLHHAITKYITNFGKDEWSVEQILNGRFGCSIMVYDYHALTGEDAGSFQNFYPSELVAIINMFEEMPEGYHKIPHLKYLIRRQDGHVNPNYPTAAAIAWACDNGYIEFINAPHLKITAFKGNNENSDTQRLIIHEKTHFLWAYTMSEEVKADWIKIGGWYLDPNANPEDPDDGWSTTKTTEFVSAYSHAVSPNEDMAESVAFYIKDPEKLRARSMAKYEFIRDRIMHGTRYISSIPDHLTFEVFNLWPDYDFPGKIKTVDIKVEGAPEEDKLLTFDIWLNHIDGMQDGASRAFTRIMSPCYKDEDGNDISTYIDLWMYPVQDNPWHLRGVATISRYSLAGYWVPGDIIVSDEVGNERYEGRNDAVTNIYINNPLEDRDLPVYEKGSLRYEVSDIEVGGHHEQLLSVKITAYDNVGIKEIYGGLYTGVDSNHMPGWNTIVDMENKTIEIQYRIRDYYYSTDYYIAHIAITDIGGISRDIRFSENPKHEPVQKIHITTPTPDMEHPEVDLNRLYVHAEPTHPEAPDGETKVEVTYYIRDNIAGLSTSGIILRDPQGVDHSYWAANGVSDDAGYYLGDPTEWRKYNATVVLPVGSAPGIWGLCAMDVTDLALNYYTYNFVETLIFEPDNSEDGWQLFAEMTEEELLNIYIPNSPTEAYGYTYRIIHEDSGREISGSFTPSWKRNEESYSVDISSFGEGTILVIVAVKDFDGNIVSVKSTTLEKGSSGISSPTDTNSAPRIALMVAGNHITIGGADVASPAVIYDLAGKTIYQGTVGGCSEYDFTSGVYILRVNDDDIVKFAIR